MISRPPDTFVSGERNMSIDIDKGVVILEVPEKNNQGSLWRFSFYYFFVLQLLHPILRFLNHFSGVVKKYFGINATESTARARANSGKCKTEDFKLNLFSQHFLDQIMSLHLMQCHRPSSIQDLCETTKYFTSRTTRTATLCFIVQFQPIRNQTSLSYLQDRMSHWCPH